MIAKPPSLRCRECAVEVSSCAIDFREATVPRPPEENSPFTFAFIFYVITFLLFFSRARGAPASGRSVPIFAKRRKYKSGCIIASLSLSLSLSLSAAMGRGVITAKLFLSLLPRARALFHRKQGGVVAYPRVREDLIMNAESISIVRLESLRGGAYRRKRRADLFLI